MKVKFSEPKIAEPRAGSFQPAAPASLNFGQSLATNLLPTFAEVARRLPHGMVELSPTPLLPDNPLPPLCLLIGLSCDHPDLARLWNELPNDARARAEREGYAIDISRDKVLVAGSTPAGAYYGLCHLAAVSERSKSLPCGRIVDWPAMARRGMHVNINGRGDLPALEVLIRDYLPGSRINELIVEVNYHYEFERSPEVREGDVLTGNDCRRLRDLAESRFVQLVPMINCLGHQSWSDHTKQLLKAHPELDETPDAPANNKGIYCRSWCPSNPATNPIVFGLIDEIVEAFEARSFHAGMDEVFILGQCALCKGTENAALFAKAVNDLYGHISQTKGLEMMIWGDRLLSAGETGYGAWEASGNGTEGAIDLIPKDILICDWHYELEYQGRAATYPSIKYFADKGFRVWPSGWNSAENARALAQCALSQPADKVVGYLCTTWVGAGAVAAGLAGNTDQPGRPNLAGVVAAIATGSQIAWGSESLRRED